MTLAAALAAAALAPGSALACACGCGIFDVGGATMVASQTGKELFVEYDELDQTQNWSGSTRAPAADNDDKRITSNFLVFGGQYMFGHDWGVMVEVPVTNRTFITTDPGQRTTFRDTSLADLRVMAVWTGLSKDKSTGLIAGVRLPTGDWRAPGFDRDVEIGSGSTDLLLGAYHFGNVGKSANWTWLVQAFADIPFAGQGGYMPGAELDTSAAAAYQGWKVDDGKVVIEPLLQVLGSFRAPDHGPAGDPHNTGYTRILVSPGLQITTGSWTLYGDVEFPIYQDVRGDQLIAPQQFKVVLSKAF